ncbi:MAG: formylglycine-generating enzyme family protein [Nitrospirae bacterium]|nr:formylglycine-generating enzyme family protein [Nitrospirota bacterium]
MYIPAGEFWMGSPDGEGESDERPRHKVYLDGYYIGKYEVTVAQYRKFCNATGRTMPGQPDLNGHDNPVVGVSWDDAKSYSEWAGMRLPTEAEWEKAARGGTDTKYWWGNSESHDYANYDGTGGLDRWSGMGPAGSFPSNGYGLYDTSGNVWEWCADWYGGGYYGSSPANNPAGPTHGSFRVLRGGSWYNAPSGVSSANRNRSDPGGRDPNDGFRCAK